MERKKKGERRRERDEEGMRESDRLGSQWVREGGRLEKRERQRQRERMGSETDMPKLYTYNEYEPSVSKINTIQDTIGYQYKVL